MAIINIKRSSSSAGEFILKDKVCGACSGCGHRLTAVRVPSMRGDLGSLELSLKAQCSILWNSWMKPLSFAVVSAVGSESLGFTDSSTVLLSFLAFWAGCLFCCASPYHVIKVSENYHA